MKAFHLCFWFALLFFNALSVIGQELTEEQKRRFKVLLEEHYAEFDLKGVVLGADGKPAKARMAIRTHSFLKKKKEGTFRFVEGPFHVRIKRASGVHLIFEMKDFYTEKRWFSVGEHEEYVTRTDKGNKFKKHGIKIELDKKGKLTTLWRYSGWLEIKASGATTVFDFSRPYSSDRYLRKCKSGELNIKELPSSVLGMEVVKEGEKIPFVKMHKKNQFVDYLKTLPTAVTLVAGENAGFLPFEPKAGRRPMRQMKMAPIKGYQRQWKLSAKDLLRNPYFYVKVDGKYGKAVIGGVKLSDDQKAVSLYLDIFLQPDKSNYLEDGQ